MMIIDASAYLGHWPFRNLRGNTPEGLDQMARRCGITHMAVSSLSGLLYRDAAQANIELHQALQGYRGETVFLPFAIINPTYPEWERDMEYAVRELGFRGVELCPAYHGYSLLGEAADYHTIYPATKAAQKAASLGVPVRIADGFENFRQRHPADTLKAFSGAEICGLLNSCPDTTFLFVKFNPVGLGLCLKDALSSRQNVFFDCSGMEAINAKTYATAVEHLGPSRLCFGSLAPLQYPEAALSKVYFTLDEGRDAVLRGNLAPVFGL